MQIMVGRRPAATTEAAKASPNPAAAAASSSGRSVSAPAALLPPGVCITGSIRLLFADYKQN